MTLPGATCLLNSFSPGLHPWDFYNLNVPSGVTLQGVIGFKLLQGLDSWLAERKGGKRSLETMTEALHDLSVE